MLTYRVIETKRGIINLTTGGDLNNERSLRNDSRLKSVLCPVLCVTSQMLGFTLAESCMLFADKVFFFPHKLMKKSFF